MGPLVAMQPCPYRLGAFSAPCEFVNSPRSLRLPSLIIRDYRVSAWVMSLHSSPSFFLKHVALSVAPARGPSPATY